MSPAMAAQIERIILDVFEFEEQVSPVTIARMFKYMSRLNPKPEIGEDDEL